MSVYVVVFAVVGLAGGFPAASAGQSGGAPSAGSTVRAAGRGLGGPVPALSAARPPALRTSCRSVVHIGDSTSDGLVSADYLPDPKLRGRSIVETLDRHPNAYTVAQRLIQAGYHGCWVLALGTNDTADVAVGSNVSNAERIQRMMSLLGPAPVMWVNVRSLVASGPYSERDMQSWDQALLRACPRYLNMRVFNWAAFAQRAWFIPDGIHFTSAGYAMRSRLIAGALATAFPAAAPPAGGEERVGPPQNCLVS